MDDRYQHNAQRLLDRFAKDGSAIQTLLDRADWLRRQFRLGDALSLCEEAFNIAAQLEDESVEAICILHRWAIHCVNRKFDEAVRDCTQAQRIFEDCGDKLKKLNTVYALGMTYEAQGKYLRERSRDKSRVAFENTINAYAYDQAQKFLDGIQHSTTGPRGSAELRQATQIVNDLRNGFDRVIEQRLLMMSANPTKTLEAIDPIPGADRANCSGSVGSHFESRQWVC